MSGNIHFYGVKLMIRLFVVAAFVLAFISLQSGRADDAAKKGFEVEKHLNLAYRDDKDADPVKHKLDVYVPKGQKEFPVLMFVHGGTWRSGNKGLYTAVGNTFAQQGIGAVVINYRLSSSDGTIEHPDHIKDVASAFAWVHENIGKYGGRNDRIFISGHSAGGHLVALLATDESYLKAHKLGFDNIRGAMPLSGVYEIIAVLQVMADAFGKDPLVWKAASPINHVKSKHPPFLIGYADNDFATIDKMSENFCKKLTDNKNEATAIKLEKRNHFTIVIQMALKADDPCTKAMLDFIAKHR